MKALSFVLGVVTFMLGMGLSAQPITLPMAPGHVQQIAPVVAGNGTNFLVVWMGESISGQARILGARLDLEGQLLDAVPLPIGVGVGDKVLPAVASNDEGDYLVVWGDIRNEETTSWDIYGCRVTGEGEVLDPEGVPIQRNDSLQFRPAAATNGTHYLVAWQEIGVFSDIKGILLGPDGVPTNEESITISDAFLDQEWPALASDGDEFLAVWQDGRSGVHTGIYGSRIDGQGNIIDGTISIVE